jgi:hypothetical protein
MADPPPAIDPDLLERLRRGVPLSMSRTGELRFDGEAITHPRVRRALREGIDVTDAGEPIVRLGPQWCYLHADDLPLRITAVERDGDELCATLDDGRVVPLLPQTLWEEPGRGLRATVTSRHGARTMAARFTNHAQVQLSAWFDPAQDDAAVLVLGDRRIAIPSSPPA